MYMRLKHFVNVSGNLFFVFAFLVIFSKINAYKNTIKREIVI